MTLEETKNRIDFFKAELDTLRPISAEQEKRIMDKFRLDWNYHSNHIEGNSLSYGETKALLLFGITAHGKPLKDHIEIGGHNEAVNYILEVVRQERPLTENFIRELHEMILKEPYQVDAITPNGEPTRRWISIGKYKTAPNHVITKTGETFRFASPEETPAMMQELMEWYNVHRVSTETYPFWLAAMFHYKFIRIHPFDDGNGRLSRILMNFILMQSGYPPVIIKTEDKENYFSKLQLADADDLESFVIYIGEQLIRSIELMVKGARGENIEDPDDLDKKILMLQKKLEGNEHVLTSKKSKEMVLIACEEIVIPFIQTLFLKFNKFDNLFLNNDITARIREALFQSYVTKSVHFDQLYQATKSLIEKRETFENLTYTKQFIEFKHAKNSFSVEVSIYVEFNEYDFIIYYSIGEEGSTTTLPLSMSIKLNDSDFEIAKQLYKSYYRNKYIPIDWNMIVSNIGNSLLEYIESKSEL